jgi:arginine-tRNA-protein transferase
MLIPEENELLRIIEPPRECSYLPWETASLEYRILHGISDQQYEELLRRGWRRFGTHFFRPACTNCSQCRSLRVQVQSFTPSKSQRRCEKRNAGIRVEIGRPQVTRTHLDLYNAYHAAMYAVKGWRERIIDLSEYRQSFLDGNWSFAYEMRYYRDRELVGVGLVDVVPTGMSSVYFYHSPDWRSESPGTYSLVREISHAHDNNKKYVYLGYWISENRSMDYKASFRPHEILDAYCSDNHEPQWTGVSLDERRT